MIVEPAPAKINLALHVRRRNPDGYHDIETLFAFATEGDLVTVAKADRHDFTITGPFATALTTAEGDNLVTLAARAFAAAFGISQRHAITLDKRLPIASGIGGGSADAAATLRALATLHGIDRRTPAIEAIARKLGADVLACLHGETALGSGRGDDLTAIAGLGGMPLLLANPGVAVSTARVFAGWDGIDRGGIPEGALLDRAFAGRNDLQPAATALVPAIAGLLGSLERAEGVRLARMSGSGATCFALFDSVAARAAAAVGARRAGHWCLETTLA
jgi:4-diphosphocytidyl-2-C-methyl-D-erythritol kinase